MAKTAVSKAVKTASAKPKSARKAAPAVTTGAAPAIEIALPVDEDQIRERAYGILDRGRPTPRPRTRALAAGEARASARGAVGLFTAIRASRWGVNRTSGYRRTGRGAGREALSIGRPEGASEASPRGNALPLVRSRSYNAAASWRRLRLVCTMRA